MNKVTYNQFFDKLFESYNADIARMQKLLMDFDWNDINEINRHKKSVELELIINSLILKKRELDDKLDKMMILLSRQHLSIMIGNLQPVLVDIGA